MGRQNEPFSGAGASTKLCFLETGASLSSHTFPVTNGLVNELRPCGESSLGTEPGHVQPAPCRAPEQAVQPARSVSLAKGTDSTPASRCLKHLAPSLCFSMHCPMIDRQMSPTVSPGLKAVLCCCTRREDAEGGCSSGSGLNPRQQSHLSIRNNPGVTGGGAGMGVTAQTAAGTGPLLVHSTENSKS